MEKTGMDHYTKTVSPEKIESSSDILHRDRMVEISRRIDWRFLLPEPALHRVAYIGPDDPELLEPLRLFSASLKEISPSEITADNPGETEMFDILIARNIDIDLLEQSVRVITPDGYVYWEVERSSAITPLRSFRYYVSYLEQLGFQDIEVYWHRPDFRNCKEMIPLLSPGALRYVFSRGQGDLNNRLKLALGRVLNQTGLLAYMVPCFSLIGCKQNR